MTIDLYIVRHGLAGEHGSYANDDERPLTDEGVRKTRRIAERLREMDVAFDLILTSPLVRARQTAEILYTTGLSPHLEESPHLAPTGTLPNWLPWFDQWRQTAGRCLALVGHEPNLSSWAEQLVWGEVKHQMVLKKAGVIELAVPEQGAVVGRCQLLWLTPPRFLLK